MSKESTYEKIIGSIIDSVQYIKKVDNDKEMANAYIDTKNEILNSTTTFGGGIYSRTVKVYSFI